MFFYVDFTYRQVRLRSIKTIVLHVNMSTTTDGYLQMDFVKFRFNKCTSTSWIRQVPHRTPSTSTNVYNYHPVHVTKYHDGLFLAEFGK